MTVWGHSQLVSHISPFTALFRAKLNTCTSLQSCPFQGLDQWFRPITRQFILTNHKSVFWPITGPFIVTNHRTSHQPTGLNKRRSCGPAKLVLKFLLLQQITRYLWDITTRCTPEGNNKCCYCWSAELSMKHNLQHPTTAIGLVIL